MFELKHYLPYLVNRAGALLAARANRDLRKLDLSLQMWRVLAALHHEDRQRVGHLAELTSIDISTLSRVIGSMEKKGLAERRREAESGPSGDQRAVTVALTPDGRAAAEEFIPIAAEYESVALEGFADDEIVRLKAYLTRMFKNLERL